MNNTYLKLKEDAKLIITHGGPTAHQDEFLSICFLFSLLGKIIPVKRREPTREELDDPMVIVVDVGYEHNEQKNNYDHHQFPRGTKQCALSLIVQSFGLEKYLGSIGWYRFLVELDSRGSEKVKETMGFPRFPYEAISPIPQALLHFFAEGRLDLKLMKRIGDNILKKVEGLRENLNWLRNNSSFVSVEGIKILYCPHNNIKNSREFIREMATAFGEPIRVQIMKDDRGAGLTLLRTLNDGSIDFARIQEDPRIRFVHSQGGHIAKTFEDLPLSEALELVKNAIVPKKERRGRNKNVSFDAQLEWMRKNARFRSVNGYRVMFLPVDNVSWNMKNIIKVLGTFGKPIAAVIFYNGNKGDGFVVQQLSNKISIDFRRVKNLMIKFVSSDGKRLETKKGASLLATFEIVCDAVTSLKQGFLRQQRTAI